MKKLYILLIAVFIAHTGFACELPPPSKQKANTATTDSVDSKNNYLKDKATLKDNLPEKKKTRYKKIVLIFV